jgi:hypothetical protein
MDDVDDLLWIRPPDADADPASADAVEVAATLEGVLLRVRPDSGDPSDPVPISMWAWSSFLAAIEADEFPDLPTHGVTFRSSQVDVGTADAVEVTRDGDGVTLWTVPVARPARTGDGHTMRTAPGATPAGIGMSQRAWTDLLRAAEAEAYRDTLAPADAAFARWDAVDSDA